MTVDKKRGTLAALNARLLLSIDSAVILYRPWLPGMMALAPVETIDQQVQNHSASHVSRTFSGDWGKSGSAPPEEKKRERQGGISHLREGRRLPFSRRLMTVSSPPLQMWCKHTLLLLSSLQCHLSPAPPPPHFLFTFLNLCLHSWSVLLLSLSPLAPCFSALAPTLKFPSFFSQSSQQGWVGGVKHCALETVMPSAFLFCVCVCACTCICQVYNNINLV